MVNIIAAVAQNRVIGLNGRLPWNIPEDHRFFDMQTRQKVCIMGRVSFEVFPEGTEHGRSVIVVSRDSSLKNYHTRVSSFGDALQVADDLPGDTYVLGGENIYRESLELTRPLRFYLTLIHANIEGDTFFPEWRHLNWTEVSRRESRDSNFRFTFYCLERNFHTG